MTTVPSPFDARLIRWKKILTALQQRSGATILAHNNVGPTDTLRETLVKVLKSLLSV